MSLDPVDLSAKLIACPSVTPREAGTLTLLTEWLEPMGFDCNHFVRGETPDGPVENLIATRHVSDEGPHFAFAGHVDVVPPGDGWDGDPFHPKVEDGQLIGRGATDMKGAIGAFVAAVSRTEQRSGTLSLLITGDEEGPAAYGTRAIIDELEQAGTQLDFCLIGEPSSVERLGDTIKHGRRGSLNVDVTVTGHQGHVAYPHLADNPIPELARLVAALEDMTLDDGDPPFQPSNLEFTALETGTSASNVIPGRASARFNIRYNRHHSGDSLIEKIRAVAADVAPNATIAPRISGDAFLTRPSDILETIAKSIEAETGIVPERSTGGGTSDGRFLHRLCPLVEFGLPNATMHKVGERAAVADIKKLANIYARILRDVLG